MPVRRIAVPPSHFSTIKKALDALFDALCVNHGISKKDAYVLIKKHLQTMSAEWFSGKAPNIAYKDPLCRLANLYCHTAVNANLCDYAIRSTEEVSDHIKHKLNDEHSRASPDPITLTTGVASRLPHYLLIMESVRSCYIGCRPLESS